MKKTKLFIFVALIICVFVFLFSCSDETPKERLGTPADLSVQVYQNRVYFYSDGLEGINKYYIYVFDQTGEAIKKQFVTAYGLADGYQMNFADGTYSASLQAISSDANVLDSLETSKIIFSTPNLDAKEEFNITLHLNGGTTSSDTVLTFKTGDEIVIEKPTKTDSVFVGWFLDQGLTYPFIPKTDYIKDFDIYAKWSDVITDDYYTGVQNLSGAALKAKLRTIISTGVNKLTYDSLKTNLPKTDASLTNPDKMLLLFSRKEVNGKWDSAATWNREHVWPQSKGWFTTSGAGSDIHHIRPEDPDVNNAHGNLPYGESLIGSSTLYYRGEIVAYYNGSYFEPLDSVKGDIARIIFYLLVRYAESDSYSITSVAQSMDMLIRWHNADPVDDFERARNQKSYEIQGNRNPFIDYPEFANLIWN